MSSVTSTSRIHRVVVHARGAVVTRSVTLPTSLSSDAFDLVIPGITPLAEPATFRAIAQGSRQVISVVAKFVVPDGPAQVGSATERVQSAEAKRVALCEERAHLTGRRNQLAGIQFDLGLERRFQKTNVRTRITDALAMTALVQDELAALDVRVAQFDREIARAEQAVQAARVAEMQARTAERAGASRPTLACSVRFGPGQTPLESLDIEYVVLAARFWPIYKAWLTKGATQVRLELDALVAQDTGEDWTGVEMSLSTADLVHDARLPELPSLRFGRATPPVKRGYRPPPPGLETMFEAYDAAMAKLTPPVVVDAMRAAPPPLPAPEPMAGFGAPPSMAMADGAYLMSESAADFESVSEMPRSAKKKSKPGSAHGRGGAPPLPPQASRLSMSRSEAMPMPKPAPGPMGGGGAPGAASYGFLAEEAKEREESDVLVGPVEPDDAWLDFDSLSLASRDEPRRGKLNRLPEETVRGQAVRAKHNIDGMSSPARTKDPYVYRGLFDYRYDAVGRGDIPSNGLPHRVHVQAGEGSAKPRFRTVPRESTDVFREALLDNPLGAPLCAGPLDVFLEGALVTTTDIAAVDRGGTIAVGLGVEDRIRIARNARIEESSAGLLGGSTHVDHHVTVDITSSLGMPILLEVLERIPVTDDKDISVKLNSAEPEPETYDQSDLGSPVRGGRRFRVDVPAGGKSKVAYVYRIKLPSKNEIVGGNRRE